MRTGKIRFVRETDAYRNLHTHSSWLLLSLSTSNTLALWHDFLAVELTFRIIYTVGEPAGAERRSLSVVTYAAGGTYKQRSVCKERTASLAASPGVRLRTGRSRGGLCGRGLRVLFVFEDSGADRS